jgi:hypothetical protein
MRRLLGAANVHVTAALAEDLRVASIEPAGEY